VLVQSTRCASAPLAFSPFERCGEVKQQPAHKCRFPRLPCLSQGHHPRHACPEDSAYRERYADEGRGDRVAISK
jgi:hypothetical protein